MIVCRSLLFYSRKKVVRPLRMEAVGFLGVCVLNVWEFCEKKVLDVFFPFRVLDASDISLAFFLFLLVRRSRAVFEVIWG